MTLKEKLKLLKQDGKAILATNFYNYETLRGVVTASKAQKTPVILQLSESSIHYMGLETALGMARALVKTEGIEAWIHLDHGKNLELAKACINAGFDSVMIDGSHLSFEENVNLTRQVVSIASKKNICVEAELGYVAKLGQAQEFDYTSPEDAKRFVELTGIDSLAIAVGNAHGFYLEEPHLAINVIHKINEITQAVLVLHGSSGIPHDQVQEAIRNGIVKINLATEIKDTFMNALKRILSETDQIDLRQTFPEAITAVSQLLVKKLNMISNA
jgi:fructose-bisphosphate aldolase class II/tagatose 1,6-diphosphate aldolase GatY/KbaY